MFRQAEWIGGAGEATATAAAKLLHSVAQWRSCSLARHRPNHQTQQYLACLPTVPLQVFGNGVMDHQEELAAALAEV